MTWMLFALMCLFTGHAWRTINGQEHCMRCWSTRRPLRTLMARVRASWVNHRVVSAEDMEEIDRGN